MIWLLIVNSIFLGVGLAMDAFSVSLANGLAEPGMSAPRMSFIASVYGIFQFAMPLIGWICVHTLLEAFEAFQPFIPWIALGLLLYIGIHLIREADETEKSEKLTFTALMVQGVATSIDALSVGFTIASYSWIYAFFSCLIVGVVTYGISLVGLVLGKKVGTRFSRKAKLLGGWVLIFLGIEIFISSFF